LTGSFLLNEYTEYTDAIREITVKSVKLTLHSSQSTKELPVRRQYHGCKAELAAAAVPSPLGLFAQCRRAFKSVRMATAGTKGGRGALVVLEGLARPEREIFAVLPGCCPSSKVKATMLW
jgi:hypothetical protein